MEVIPHAWKASETMGYDSYDSYDGYDGYDGYDSLMIPTVTTVPGPTTFRK